MVTQYKKRDHKKEGRYLTHGISAHLGGNGIVNHYRYKGKYNVVPIKQNSTILLHRQYHYHHHHKALHHNYHYISSNKNDNIFKNCKIF